MCGRFSLDHSAQELAERFDLEQLALDLQPRYNIAPTQPVLAVVQSEQRSPVTLRWGLVPFWAKDPAIGNRMINARADGLADKPAYRAPLRRRRCLIPASGFYEWRQGAGGKIPTYVHLRDHGLMGLAGLWDEWRSPEGEVLRSCTIVTTSPNAFMAPIHDRMPVILPAAREAAWLDPAVTDVARLTPLLVPYTGTDLEAHAVSRKVNDPGYDAPDCIQAAA
ncbi:MAG: SOS response-associated peptidase [Candidatus Latescibacterota bacterium]